MYIATQHVQCAGHHDLCLTHDQLLLNELVNKLGDPNRRIASKCILFLLKLCELMYTHTLFCLALITTLMPVNHHVNMKLVVVREIESLLYRSNISSKAQ